MLHLSAIGAGVGFGACSLGAFTPLSNGRFGGNLTTLGAVVFFASLAVLISTILVFAVQQLCEAFRR